MNGITFIAGAAGLVLLAIFIIGMVFARLYKRATPEESFVRTGFGGSKAVASGGALIIPILHDIKRVNMKTIRLEIKRQGSESLITSDKFRADATVAFFVRVGNNDEDIKTAARTFGEKLQEPADVQAQVESKLDGALRAVAGEMTLAQLQ